MCVYVCVCVCLLALAMRQETKQNFSQSITFVCSGEQAGVRNHLQIQDLKFGNHSQII